MYVLKRDGRKEAVQFDKITERIKKLVYGLNPDFVDASSIAQKVIGGVYPGVTTSELDGEFVCGNQIPTFGARESGLRLSTALVR